jgi:hypothetical protein
MKNLHTFEEFVNESLNEGTTPHYKRLIKRAKEEGISTDSELYDLISDEFPDDQITGADYEEARKVLKITESVVNEGDMTRDYDGFIVSDTDSKKNLHWKFRYMKGIRNNKVEDIAIAKVMKETGKSRADYWVTGAIKKGEWNKSDAQEI